MLNVLIVAGIVYMAVMIGITVKDRLFAMKHGYAPWRHPITLRKLGPAKNGEPDSLPPRRQRWVPPPRD